MTTSISFRVHGLPGAQGSKRHVGNGVMVESSKKVKPWRQDVTAAAVAAMNEHGDRVEFTPFSGPVRAHITFYFPRPRSHYGTGRNADQVKVNAPAYVSTKPDIDKILRSTFDAITTSGLWRDDNLVVSVATQKVYGEKPGAQIAIYPALDERGVR